MAAPFQEQEEDNVVRPESLLLLLLMGGLLFLLFTRSRRQQRAAQQLQSGLAAGARVMTTAGLYATVVGIEDSVVVLETSPGQTSRWDRRAIARVLPEEPVDDHDTHDHDHDTYDHDTHNHEALDHEELETLEDDLAVGTGTSSHESAPPERS